MKCLNPVLIKTPEGNIVKAACGKCKLCTMLRRREWTIRLMNELEYFPKSTFVTLTFSDEHLPDDFSIHKEVAQNWQKAVRKLSDEKLKFYTVGEYGEKSFRPHYHSIVYGLSPDDEDLFHKTWKKGFIYLGSVTHDSIQYVAGYVQKKLYGNTASEMYTLNGLEPPFSLMSKGLGLRWCLANEERINNELDIKMYNKSYGIPRYYVKKLGLNNSFDLLAKQLETKNKKLDNLAEQGLSSEYLSAVEKRERMQRNYDCQSYPMRQRKL